MGERERAVQSRETQVGKREATAETREMSLREREELSGVREEAVRAREEAAEARIEREHLVVQMREANQHLVLATVRAQELLASA